MTQFDALPANPAFGFTLDSPRVAHLTQTRFIRASGPDARSFLQGQVTCDTLKINASQSVRGALCNLKGRVIADFLALQIGDDILLQVQASVAEKVLGVLKKYAVFSKLVLSIETDITAYGLLIPPSDTQDILARFGVTSAPASKGEAATGNGSTLFKSHAIAEGIEVFEAWSTEAPLEALSGIEEITAENWAELEYRSGIVHIADTTSEEYTPALLNYDINGIVDFKKGCYTGQEIVARMFYRSTPKKRLFGLIAANALSGSTEYKEASEQIIEQALASAGRTLLALLPVEANTQKYALQDGSPLELIEFTDE